ncbi:hypothetical protein V8J36_05255 [Frigidibacter sp. MR17.14]|uniref:hypothetical protein n=1 Tax=Frigidibacter sp. MR17.14 TaxID=3126509 RepID=UPI003012A712
MTLAMILLALSVPAVAVPPIVAALYAGVWEWRVQRSPLGDGIVDTAAVACGAGVIAAPDPITAGACQALLLTFVAIGLWRRSRFFPAESAPERHPTK